MVWNDEKKQLQAAAIFGARVAEPLDNYRQANNRLCVWLVVLNNSYNHENIDSCREHYNVSLLWQLYFFKWQQTNLDLLLAGSLQTRLVPAQPTRAT